MPLQLSDVDAMLATNTRIPAAAWRLAGIAPEPGVATLADCSVEQLARFGAIDVTTMAGRQFRNAAFTIHAALVEGASHNSRPRPAAA